MRNYEAVGREDVAGQTPRHSALGIDTSSFRRKLKVHVHRCLHSLLLSTGAYRYGTLRVILTLRLLRHHLGEVDYGSSGASSIEFDQIRLHSRHAWDLDLLVGV